MAALNDLKVLIIGPGPTNIGQTGEGLEGALEACRVLAEAGCRIITVGANPDAVFNEAPWSHHTILAPLVPETISNIIAAEKPDALLTLFGGRNSLQLISGLYSQQIASANRMALWGPTQSCLDHVRDRDTLQSAMAAIGLKTPPIYPVSGVDAAMEKAKQLGFPVVVRCDDAHVLPDGLLLYNQDELNTIATSLAGDGDSKFSVEASLLDWQQVELEVLRDRTGRSVLLGGVEYLDTAGVHPGDAIGVSPMQTISESLQALLLKDAVTICDHLDIVGGATIRFAVRAGDQQRLVLAVHPRYTSTSAMVTRISGIPVARWTALLAAGQTLDQLAPELPEQSPFEPSYTCVGIKWPRWDLAQLGVDDDRLGPQMQATGHHVSYATDFKTAFHKASRTADIDGRGLVSIAREFDGEDITALLPRLSAPSTRRPYEIFAALMKGAGVDEVAARTHMATDVIRQIHQLTETAKKLSAGKATKPSDALMRQAKAEGFSNADIALLLDTPLDDIKAHLEKIGVKRKWQALPGSDHDLRFGDFNSGASLPVAEGSQKVIILGNGAYGIGNGTECDYAAFHAAVAVRQMGYTPILINSNLAGHLSGHSAPCTCYCEPLSVEEISEIIGFEQPVSVICQFAGTNAHALASRLQTLNCELAGTTQKALRLHQDPVGFKEEIHQLGLPQPAFALAATVEEAKRSAEKMTYPIIISDNGATSSAVVRDPQELGDHLAGIFEEPGRTIWMEQFLEYAIEAQAEVLCDGETTQTVAVLEHIELAGVHAGDSAAVLPPYSIAPRHVETIRAYSDKIATSFGIRGSINIRFGIYRDTVYVLSAGSNVSRNLAMISKALNVPVVAWAVRLMLGDRLSDLGIALPQSGLCSVRAPVFPFNSFSKIDPLLGPNMRATGQVMSIADTFGMAYFNALESTQNPLPTAGTVLITVTDEDKPSILEPARIFNELGFKIMSTRGTHKVLSENGIESTQVRKLGYGRPNLVDEIKNGKVQMVINTPTGGQGQIDDSVIRKAAIGCRVANVTTPASALAAAKGIAAARSKGGIDKGD